jgi:MinD superfamily P-loop ATPase
MVRVLQLRFGVVINRAGLGDDDVLRYCHQDGIRILTEIQDDRRIAEAYSRGQMVCEALPEYRSLFEGLLKAVTEEGGQVGDRNWQTEMC